MVQFDLEMHTGGLQRITRYAQNGCNKQGLNYGGGDIILFQTADIVHNAHDNEKDNHHSDANHGANDTNATRLLSRQTHALRIAIMLLTTTAGRVRCCDLAVLEVPQLVLSARTHSHRQRRRRSGVQRILHRAPLIRVEATQRFRVQHPFPIL